MSTLTVCDAFPPNTAAGNTCYRCHASPREQFGVREKVLDLGISIDFEGGLALCQTCVEEMGRRLGMVPAHVVTELEADLNALRARVDEHAAEMAELEARAERAEEALRTITAIRDEPADAKPRAKAAAAK